MMLQIAPQQHRAYTYDVTATTPVPSEFLDLLKSNARVTTTVDDALLTFYLNAAIEYFELKTGRTLFNKTFETFRDFFPQYLCNEGYYQGGIGFQRSFNDNNSFLLRRSPVSSVVEIDYDPIAAPTVPVIIASTVYYVSIQADYSEVLSRVGQEWPQDLLNPQEQSIRIRFIAGYGTALADIPADIQLGIIAYATWMYDNRGDCCDDCDVAAAMKSAIRCYKILDI